MTTISGAAAAITGAAGGIGAALARQLAASGCDLALADVNEQALVELARDLRAKHGRRVSVHGLDVARRDQVEAFAAAALAEHPKLNIVVNNAGVALFGMLDELELADIEWLMGINFWGVVHGTRAFLPHLRTRPEAHIVNVSSIFGIIAPPGQTAYAAAKFAVRGFSESLRHELQVQRSPVRLSVVHPGGIDTGIALSARVGARMTDNIRRAQSLDQWHATPKTSPEAAAERIISGIVHNEPRILIGDDARRVDFLQRLRPGTYWATLARIMERRLKKSLAGKTGSKQTGDT